MYLLYDTNYNQNYRSNNIKSIKHGSFKKTLRHKKAFGLFASSV